MSQDYEAAIVPGWLDPWGGWRSTHHPDQEPGIGHSPRPPVRTWTSHSFTMLPALPEPRVPERWGGKQGHSVSWTNNKKIHLILEFILRKLYLSRKKAKTSPAETRVHVTRNNRGEPPAPTPGRTEWWMKWGKKKSSNTDRASGVVETVPPLINTDEQDVLPFPADTCPTLFPLNPASNAPRTL